MSAYFSILFVRMQNVDMVSLAFFLIYFVQMYARKVWSLSEMVAFLRPCKIRVNIPILLFLLTERIPLASFALKKLLAMVFGKVITANNISRFVPSSIWK